MSEPVPVSKGKGSNAARYAQAGQSRHVNAYSEEIGEEGKTQDITVAINGWAQWGTMPNGNGIRKMLVVDSVVLTVAGRLVFSNTMGGGNGTVVGAIPSDGLVTMAANRKTPNRQVALVCDGLWFLREGANFVQGTDPDLPPPIAVVELDGFFIFIIPDGRWFIAGPNEGSAIDPLDFAEAEASSDANVMGVVRGRTLIILGGNSAEFWDPTPDPDFPFTRTAAINVGCYAGATVQKLLVTKKNQAAVETVIFAATNHEGAYVGVVALNGYNAVPISTPEVDRLVRDEPDKTLLSAMAWVEDGIPFYCLSGSSFSITWNGKRQEWNHRRSSGSPRWNAACQAQFGNLVLFGHRTTNKVYQSRFDLLDEDGLPIVMQIQPPPIGMWPKNMKVSKLWLDFITGVGGNTGNTDNDDPEVIIDYSRDGGDNFAVAQRRKLGAMGQKQTRVKMGALGRFDHNGLTLRMTISAKVSKGLQQLSVAATPLRG